jgi:hypothetical protein
MKPHRILKYYKNSSPEKSTSIQKKTLNTIQKPIMRVKKKLIIVTQLQDTALVSTLKQSV